MADENPENEELLGSYRTTTDLRQEAEEALRLYAAQQKNKRSTQEDVDTSRFVEGMLLRVEVQGSETPILVVPKAEIVIGRRDPASGSAPEIDLAPYAAYQMGISRKHAIIRWQNEQLFLHDLGSRNGTYVNGQKASPSQPIQLRDGDEMRLGKMHIRLYFRRKNA